MEVPTEAAWQCCTSSCLLWLNCLYNHLLQTQPGQKAAVGTVEGREVQIWALLTALCRDGVIRNHSIAMLPLKNGGIFIFIFSLFVLSFYCSKSSTAEAECVVSSSFSSFVSTFWQ